MRHRTDRPGRDGREPGPEHREPRLSRRRLQSHRRARSTSFIAGRAKGKNFVGCHSLEELVDNLANAAQGDADGQGRPGGRRVHRAADPAALARRRDHRRRQHATSPTPSAARSTSSRRACCTSAPASPAAKKGALKGPSMMPGGSRDGLAAGEADLPGDRRQGRARRTTSPAANGSARAAPGHYVKMVHNGIEYGDMQLICEAYFGCSSTPWACRTTSCTTSSPSGTAAS